MEEDEYRSTYHSINQVRCVFEKAINARRCHCSQAHRFNLADREGVACQTDLASRRCRSLLDILRDKACFALKLNRVDGPLPHAREIKVQVGGIQGLASLLEKDSKTTEAVDDIHNTITQCIEHYQSLEALPYDEIIKSIARFQGRRSALNKGG